MVLGILSICILFCLTSKADCVALKLDFWFKIVQPIEKHIAFYLLFPLRLKATCSANYDLTMDGIHENFLGLSYIDPMMTKTFTCLDMLGVSDLFHQYIMRTQQMSLHAFQPPLAIAIKRLIFLFDKPNIEWPKSLQRCRAMSMEKDMLKFWQSKLLRETPGRSLNPSDEYDEDGQASTIKKSGVIHERITTSTSVQDNDKPRVAMTELQNKDNHKNSNSEIKKIASNRSFALQTTCGDSKKPSGPTSFFDRFRQGCNTDSKNDASNLQKAATAERDSRPFLFKYNEGFTNAVKRSVKVRELLF